MSSTNRGAEREPNEGYYTPDALADAIVGSTGGTFKRVLEPSVGRGAFVRALLKHAPGVVVDSVDVDPDIRPVPGSGGTYHQMRFEDAPLVGGYDLVIGNPPYSLATAHLERALSLLASHGMVAFVLRLNYLGAEQFDRLRDCLRSVQVITPRPKFTDKGSDSCEYAVFWFGRSSKFGGRPKVMWLWWDKPGATKPRRRT